MSINLIAALKYSAVISRGHLAGECCFRWGTDCCRSFFPRCWRSPTQHNAKSMRLPKPQRRNLYGETAYDQQSCCRRGINLSVSHPRNLCDAGDLALFTRNLQSLLAEGTRQGYGTDQRRKLPRGCQIPICHGWNDLRQHMLQSH